jgi:2',3'-cyclic-nucleotide 2'-phosphodiesterase (5'-nucleotidase family)
MKTEFFIYLLFFLQSSLYCIEEEEIIDLKDEKYNAIPTPDDKNIYYIPIIHTNDIHGSFYPKKILLPDNEMYSIGGLEYLGKYASIMSEEWGERFLYFDTGDQFQGGIEGYISQGNIMMDFFNTLKVKKSVFGNHEFDYGIPFLKEYMDKANFDWIIDNVKNTTTGKYITFPKQKKSMIIEAGDNNFKVKLGIIGLATKETIASTNTKIDDLFFDDYVKIIEEESNKLKAKGANAIIVIGHLGLYCRNDPDEVKLEYKYRDIKLNQSHCRETDEAYKLLHKLKNNTIDILLAGHRHDVTHHWVNGFPVMSNDRNGKYAQIVYLPFDRKTKELINDKIVFEGPLPVCEKIFSIKKICDLPVITNEEYEKYGKLKQFKFHNKLIEKDSTITNIANNYSDLFNEYDRDVLTHTEEHFEGSKEHETNMGNFYTDFLRHISGADIALINGGAFRTPFYRGNITNATVYSFDPFGNDIVKFQAYGKEIIRMLRQLQSSDKGFYPTSGLRMTVRKNPSKKLLSIKLWDGYNEEDIDDERLYTIVSNDFCFPLEPDEVGGDDFAKVYEWFRPRNHSYISVNNFNSTRDVLINYMRNIYELKGSKYYDENNLRMRVVD